MKRERNRLPRTRGLLPVHRNLNESLAGGSWVRDAGFGSHGAVPHRPEGGYRQEGRRVRAGGALAAAVEDRSRSPQTRRVRGGRSHRRHEVNSSRTFCAMAHPFRVVSLRVSFESPSGAERMGRAKSTPASSSSNLCTYRERSSSCRWVLFTSFPRVFLHINDL